MMVLNAGRLARFSSPSVRPRLPHRVVAPVPVSAALNLFDPGATKVLEGELDRAVPPTPAVRNYAVGDYTLAPFSRGFLLCGEASRHLRNAALRPSASSMCM